MASKKKADKDTSFDLNGIEQHSRQIWLAGLGAFAQGGVDGGKAFDSLVKEGEKAEKQAKAEASKALETAKAAPLAKGGSLKEKALSKWGELEEAFDQRLDSAMSRLGVPSRNEIAALHEKVDTLMKELAQLSASAPTAPRAATSRANPKPAAKPVAVKPVAAKRSTAKPVVAKPSAAQAEPNDELKKKPRARKPAASGVQKS